MRASASHDGEHDSPEPWKQMISGRCRTASASGIRSLWFGPDAIEDGISAADGVSPLPPRFAHMMPWAYPRCDFDGITGLLILDREVYTFLEAN